MSNRKNLANGILASAVNDTTTTWTLESGYGAGMPDVPFYITATPFGQLPTQGNSEIVNVTARSGDTLTVTRGAKGTTAKAFAAGAVVANAIYDDEKWTSDNIDWATFGQDVSLSEQKTTMKDIDGDPIYKKTVRGVFSDSSGVYSGAIDPGIVNFKRLIDMTGMAYVLSGTSGVSPTNYTWAHRAGAVYNTEQYGVYFRPSDGIINVRCVMAANRSLCMDMTLYYTKTVN